MGLKRKPTARPAIELEIGQLVLDGVAPSDRHRVAAAVESELEGGVPAGPEGRRGDPAPATEDPVGLYSMVTPDCRTHGGLRATSTPPSARSPARLGGRV